VNSPRLSYSARVSGVLQLTVGTRLLARDKGNSTSFACLMPNIEADGGPVFELASGIAGGYDWRRGIETDAAAAAAALEFKTRIARNLLPAR
jgi:hypothetical protein